jgi:2-polyprenyl-3-methyl-5-hydroxy-6-metoxy-1,4-benzoquinol methylase
MQSSNRRAADNITGLYERHAEIWDTSRGKTLFERSWLDRFAALIPQGGTILDIGCGSGEPLARHFIESGYAVTGIDSSPSLIAMCRTRFPNSDWQVADMRSLSLKKDFDGLIAWDSFFHLTFEDQRRMFRLFQTHARPRAALMFTSGPAHGEAMGVFVGEPLYHSSLSPDEYRALLNEHGFAVIAQKAEDPACGNHTVWLAQYQ